MEGSDGQLARKWHKNSFTIREHLPKKEEIQGSIGQYLLLSSIAKGGMGEVFLAFDTVSGRRVALKRIRPDFVSSPLLKQRFLKEARITSQLIHPAIIPIYNIHIDGDLIYYTMPYVQGTTLRELLKKARDEEDLPHTSITALTRIFLSITQAIAYAHSRGVLHRDIKPENIIIGPYGQVIILDWGLTKPITEIEEALPEQADTLAHTKVGKLVGTIAYMAPERAEHKPSTIQTDIFSLGVILYQILTLTLPFKRKSIDAFLTHAHEEQYMPPEARAPYRDVPRALSELVKMCLEKDPAKRIGSCDEIVEHIENYLEGRSEWFFVSSLQPDRFSDWQIHENILFSTYPFKRREQSDWYRLMISSQLFADNIRLEMHVTLDKAANGIGILLAVPVEKERTTLTDGYCLWLSTKRDADHTTMLLRSSILVTELPHVALSPEKQHEIILQKTDKDISLLIDGNESFHHTCHVPVVGPHIGLIVQDGHFSLSSLQVFTGSQNIMVNCLAVPDAFLAAHAYEKAYASYNRLAELFPGHAEEREALFRAGIALLERARKQSDPAEREANLNLALAQFQKLRGTAGAPLEYLGKTFVYQANREYLEESKCFEIAFRRYRDHPYLNVLQEHLLVRLHETLKSHRLAASYFIALALRFLPPDLSPPSTRKLWLDIKSEWEWPHYFPEKDLKSSSKEEGKELILLALSFWLEQPHIAFERLELFVTTPILPKKLIETALLSLKALGNQILCQKAIDRCKEALSSNELKQYDELFSFLMLPPSEAIPLLLERMDCSSCASSLSVRFLIVFLDLVLEEQAHLSMLALQQLYERIPPVSSLAARVVELLIRNGQMDKAKQVVQRVEKEEKIHETNSLFFLKGCLLAYDRGLEAALDYFHTAKECMYPPYWNLACYALAGTIVISSKAWGLKAYHLELTTLYRHLNLFNRVTSQDLSLPQVVKEALSSYGKNS